MKPAKAKKLPFETSMHSLEDIVKKLEKGDLPLEEALQFYEKGIHLARDCQNALKDAELKVKMLTEESDKLLADLENSDTPHES